MLVKKLRLMPEYYASPVWSDQPGYVGDIDLGLLPVSHGLKEDLTKWQQVYENILDLDDPASSGFGSIEEILTFDEEGKSLLKRLQAELGSEYSVRYVPIGEGYLKAGGK